MHSQPVRQRGGHERRQPRGNRLHGVPLVDRELPAEAMQGFPPLPALFELHLTTAPMVLLALPRPTVQAH